MTATAYMCLLHLTGAHWRMSQDGDTVAQQAQARVRFQFWVGGMALPGCFVGCGSSTGALAVLHSCVLTVHQGTVVGSSSRMARTPCGSLNGFDNCPGSRTHPCSSPCGPAREEVPVIPALVGHDNPCLTLLLACNSPRRRPYGSGDGWRRRPPLHRLGDESLASPSPQA